MKESVNIVKDLKTGKKYAIHDARLETVPQPVKAQEGKLLIDEVVQPVGPTPVATIDGVEYFHKYEFDLEEYPNDYNSHYYDILTGEISGHQEKARIYKVSIPQDVIVHRTELVLWNDKPYGEFILHSDYYSVDYTSRAFTVVQTREEVTDKTKICLPGCTAYYGFLSADGKTFISYWNEEGEGSSAIPVTKVKDKNGVEADIQDSRVDGLITEVENKQDTLIAGDNITIENNVISASGGEQEFIKILKLGNNSTIGDILDFFNITESSPNTQEYFNLELALPWTTYSNFINLKFIKANYPGAQGIYKVTMEWLDVSVTPREYKVYEHSEDIFSDLKAISLNSIYSDIEDKYMLLPLCDVDEEGDYALSCHRYLPGPGSSLTSNYGWKTSEAGTKLYKHTLKVASVYNGEFSENNLAYIISTQDGAYTDIPSNSSEIIKVSVFRFQHGTSWCDNYEDYNLGGLHCITTLHIDNGSQEIYPNQNPRFSLSFKSNAQDFDTVEPLF